MGQQMTAVICVRPGQKGKVYISADDIESFLPDTRAILSRIEKVGFRKDSGSGVGSNAL